MQVGRQSWTGMPCGSVVVRWCKCVCVCVCMLRGFLVHCVSLSLAAYTRLLHSLLFPVSHCKIGFFCLQLMFLSRAARTRTHARPHAHTDTNIDTQTHTHTHTRTQPDTRMDTHAHAHIHTHIHTHARTHAHTHANMASRRSITHVLANTIQNLRCTPVNLITCLWCGYGQ